MSSTLKHHRAFGLGLRKEHYQDFLSDAVPVDFVEIISENFMVEGGKPLHTLDRIREKYRVAMHGVSMSIGSHEGLDHTYLNKLKKLADRINPLFVSDHLCWTGTGGFNSHDLLPIPYSGEALERVCANIRIAQDVLERPMLLENPSSYLAFPDAEFTEWEFLAEMCQNTGCYLLLDINNIYVSGCNNAFDPMDFLAGMPADRVRQVHLAGHSHSGDVLIDTHDAPICDAVWELYEAAQQRLGPVATMIERDDHIPPLPELLAELEKARRLALAPV